MTNLEEDVLSDILQRAAEAMVVPRDGAARIMEESRRADAGVRRLGHLRRFSHTSGPSSPDEGPDAADVASGSPATVDLKLRKTKNLSKQLTNAEWMMSMPGSDDDKLQLLNCVSCHTLERIVKSTHDADEFVHQLGQ